MSNARLIIIFEVIMVFTVIFLRSSLSFAEPQACSKAGANIINVTWDMRESYTKGKKSIKEIMVNSQAKFDNAMRQVESSVAQYPECKKSLDAAVSLARDNLDFMKNEEIGDNDHNVNKRSVTSQNFRGYAQENVMKPKRNKGDCKPINLNVDLYKADRFSFYSSMGLECQSLSTAVVCAGGGIMLSFNFFDDLKKCEDHLKMLK